MDRRHHFERVTWRCTWAMDQRILSKLKEVFISVHCLSSGFKLSCSQRRCAPWGDDSCPEYGVGHSTASCLWAVWDTLRLDSGPKLCSADVTGQISVTPANIFKPLPSGCRRHWEVLEMIALTVSDANHSWKGDSTFGCYLLRERKKIPTSLTSGAFWSLIHTGCGKCVWYIHISKESFWREKHAVEIISRHRAFNTLMILCFLGASLLIDKLSFHKKAQGGTTLRRSRRALTHANGEYLRRLLDVFYADNIWQAWNEARADMKAGTVCQNQEIISPTIHLRGPSESH